MRHFGPPPSPRLVYRERRGAYGVIRRDGSVLLAEQDGKLLLPGGGIDPGESPIQALHREVREETGWRIGPPVFHGAFARHDWLVEERYRARKVALIYGARAIRPLGPPLESDHRPVWVAASVAPALLSVEGEAIVLAEILERGPTR